MCKCMYFFCAKFSNNKSLSIISKSMKCLNDYIVNTKLLKSNVDNIKSKLEKKVKFCAVVKANAYGVGVHTVCGKLYGLADFFAVANLKEALAIRVFDKQTKILILGAIHSDEYDECASNNISVSISSINHLYECLRNVKSTINIHLQVNTGLNRFGFRSLSVFKNALKLIEDSKLIKLEGLYSHFATKEKDKIFIKKQFYKFGMFRRFVNKKVICHIANSYALTLHKDYQLDMVRTGFLMYAGDERFGNKMILTIKSKIVNILTVRKSESIGYDRSYCASKKMKVAVIPIGYADGLDRRLSNNFSLLINGVKCKIVGKICMDVCMVDVTDVDCSLYDEVVVLGKQKRQIITLQDYANALDTSLYEILLKFNYSRMNYIEIN